MSLCSAFHGWNLAAVLCDYWPDISICRAEQSPSALDLTAGIRVPISSTHLLPSSQEPPASFYLPKVFFLCLSSVFPSVLSKIKRPKEAGLRKGECSSKNIYFSRTTLFSDGKVGWRIHILRLFEITLSLEGILTTHYKLTVISSMERSNLTH